MNESNNYSKKNCKSTHLKSQHWGPRDRSIHGACWSARVANQEALGSMRDPVSKKRE